MANRRKKRSRVDGGRLDVQKGVRRLTRSVKEIQASLRGAERYRNRCTLRLR